MQETIPNDECMAVHLFKVNIKSSPVAYFWISSMYSLSLGHVNGTSIKWQAAQFETTVVPLNHLECSQQLKLHVGIGKLTDGETWNSPWPLLLPQPHTRGLPDQARFSS